MQEANRIAFKEWASIVEAVGTGAQVLLLRKGGVHEKGKKFNVAHDEFFLFPTFEHQNPEDLKPEGVEILNKILQRKPNPSILPLRYYCVVHNSFLISDEKALERLEPFHLWSWDCIKARFDWGEEKGLFGITVRAYSLPETMNLENLKQYGGCRSWVELEKPLSTVNLKPVLSHKIFELKNKEINEVLREFVTSREGMG